MSDFQRLVNAVVDSIEQGLILLVLLIYALCWLVIIRLALFRLIG